MNSLDQPRTADARAILARGSVSFNFAGRFLPADRRDDAAVVYAFCRYVDDLADEAADLEEARQALALLSAELRQEEEPRPFIKDVLALFHRCGIDVRHALNLIEGVVSDLQLVRVKDDAELVQYSYRVAGTVGLMMSGVLGVRDTASTPFAIDLGVAMQLTNICRDVAEDARNDRIYLPQTRLEGHGIPMQPELLRQHREGVRRVIQDLLAMADRYYESAMNGMRYIPWRTRLAIVVAAQVYRAIGVKLLRDGGDSLAGRTIVPLSEKLYWAAHGVWLAVVSIPFRRRPHVAALHRSLAGLPGVHG